MKNLNSFSDKTKFRPYATLSPWRRALVLLSGWNLLEGVTRHSTCSCHSLLHLRPTWNTSENRWRQKPPPSLTYSSFKLLRKSLLFLGKNYTHFTYISLKILLFNFLFFAKFHLHLLSFSFFCTSHFYLARCFLQLQCLNRVMGWVLQQDRSNVTMFNFTSNITVLQFFF